jgi:hypothetical protein
VAAEEQAASNESGLGLLNLNRTALWKAMDRSLSDMGNEKMILGATLTQVSVGIATTLSTGFVTWVLRGGALASALLSSMPAWRGFDPLVILIARRRKNEKDEAISKVDRVFEKVSSVRKRSQRLP